MALQFQLCTRCKRLADSLIIVSVGNYNCGEICADCIAPITQLIETEMQRIPIPDALIPYLPKKTP